MEVKVLRKSSGLTSKMDNTFVYNIVAKCIVLFDFHFYSHFYSQLLN
jgi:hypothetical protein